MADRYLLESGSPDGYLLEDGSGVLLLETGVFWDPISGFNKNQFLTLSNSNLTSTSDGQGQWESVRANLPTAVSAFRFEVTLVTGSTPTNILVGVENGLTDFSALNALPGSSNNNGVALQLGGTGWVILRSGGVSQGPFGSPAAASGQIVTVVVDKAAQTVAFLVNGTQIGVNETTVSFTNWYAYVSGKDAATSAGIGNFGASAFSFGTGSAYDGSVTGTTVSPSVGHLTFGGKALSLTLTLNPVTGHLAFGGKVSSVSVGTSVSPTVGHLAFSGKLPSATINIAVSPSAGHLTFGGKVPTVTRTTAVSAVAGHLTLTGKLPTVVLGVNVFPSAGHLTISGKIPTIALTFRVSPSAGHIAFGGKVPTVSISSGLLPSTGHLVFSGKVPVLTTTLNPATGHLAFSGHVSVLGVAVGPNTGHIVFAGHLSLFGGPIMPLAGHIAFSGNTPAITYGIGAIGHIKVDLGSFVAKPVKFWSGTGWVTKPLKRWTGTAWRATSY